LSLNLQVWMAVSFRFCFFFRIQFSLSHANKTYVSVSVNAGPVN
jgi:hypothetical protein